MRKFLLFLTLLMALALVLVACGGDDSEDGAADNGSGETAESRGEALYKQQTIGDNNAPGCITCHSLEPGVVLVGASHAGLGSRAGSTVPGMTAEEYIRESIVDPNAYVVEGFAEGVMYQNYGEDLTEQEISDLVAFLLSLEE